VRLREFARREGIELLSLVPPLRRQAEATGECLHGAGRSLACYGHWNEKGHVVAGEELARTLCADLGTAAATAY